MLTVSDDQNHRDTVDTHNGEQYNIKGMGEGMDFGVKSEYSEGFTESSELPQDSQDFGALDVNGLTATRMQKKMRKKK